MYVTFVCPFPIKSLLSFVLGERVSRIRSSAKTMSSSKIFSNNKSPDSPSIRKREKKLQKNSFGLDEKGKTKDTEMNECKCVCMCMFESF